MVEARGDMCLCTMLLPNLLSLAPSDYPKVAKPSDVEC